MENDISCVSEHLCGLSHSVCMRVGEQGCTRRLIKHGEGLLRSPSSSPTTVYNVTVYFPHSVLLPSFCPPPLSLFGGGFTFCLCVSVKTFDWFNFGGESFVVLFVLFVCFFVKLMIHIVLEPPATIKTVKSCSGVCYIYCTICTLDLLLH